MILLIFKSDLASRWYVKQVWKEKKCLFFNLLPAVVNDREDDWTNAKGLNQEDWHK